MRRRPNQLLPLERDVLAIAADLIEHNLGTSPDGAGWFHAYRLAELLAERHGEGLLAHGTLYRSLATMAERELLERRIEEPAEKPSHAGPPRRYYRITNLGLEAVKQSELKVSRRELRRLRPGLSSGGGLT